MNPEIPSQNPPSPDSSREDNGELLDVFPEELWLAVLRNVTNVTEYYKTCAASPHFANLFPKEHRCLILFAQVIQILSNQLLGGGGGTTKELLKLRIVCQSWKLAVDNYLQHIPLLAKFPSASVLVNSVVFGSYNDVQKFQRDFEESHLPSNQNPFFTRSVIVTLPTGDIFFSRYLNALLRAFDSFGGHVWHCKMVQGMHQDPVRDTQACVVAMIDVLKNLPSLKSLVFELKVSLRPFPITREKQIYQVPLQNLEQWTGDRFPTSVLFLLVKMCVPETNDKREVLQPIRLPKFSRMSLRIKGFEDLVSLRKATVSFALTNLKITVDLPVSLAFLLRVLGDKFGETLKVLELSLPESTNLNTADVNMQSFLNLRILHLKLQSLVPLAVFGDVGKTLKEFFLDVTRESCPEIRNLGKIKEIWSALPNLDKFQCSSRVDGKQWTILRKKMRF